MNLLLELCLPGFPGSRGLLLETWNTKSNIQDIGNLLSSAEDYHAEVLAQGRFVLNATSQTSSRISGFFIPPKDDNYTFHIRSDGHSELYMNFTTNSNSKVQ